MNVPQTVRDDVERLYTLLLGEIQGKRPEYVMTALCQIVYDAHDLPFEPPKFLENLNLRTFLEYYEFVWRVLASKRITTLRTPGVISLEKSSF